MRSHRYRARVVPPPIPSFPSSLARAFTHCLSLHLADNVPASVYHVKYLMPELRRERPHVAAAVGSQVRAVPRRRAALRPRGRAVRFDG